MKNFIEDTILQLCIFAGFILLSLIARSDGKRCASYLNTGVKVQ